MIENYVRAAIQNGERLDQRKLDAYRPINVTYGVSKHAEGSARCTMGATDVIAGIKLDVGEPYPDTPDEGSIIVTVELSPVASPNFELGPPGTQATELARIIDRGIRESKCIDLKKLCIKKGEKIWMVFIDIYPLNDAGNLIDASALAAVAALQKTKMPKLLQEKVQYGKLTTAALPVSTVPITCTVGKVGEKFIIDPDKDEEGILDARLSIAVVNGNIHALQKGGNQGITLADVEQGIDVAVQKEKELRKHL